MDGAQSRFAALDEKTMVEADSEDSIALRHNK
jgi:hypothetical protein